jgi:predicted nucleic acid-binding protein
MFNNFTILDFDSSCAASAAKIYLDLKNKGLLIEAEDLLIAATDVRRQTKLATGNIRHFSRVMGLGLLGDEGLELL